MTKTLIIAIDGPAGSGKSTIGKMVAERLGYVHLSTGAMYRAIGWKAQQEGIGVENISGLTALIERTEIEFRRVSERDKIFVDGNDVTEILATNDAGKLASAVAAIPEVRHGLLSLQRRAGKHGGVVLDGRDIGTVVFPDADVKFYLDASPEERAQRRFIQLSQQGIATDLTQLIADITQRDQNDSSRTVAPLRRAEDAIYIDSSSLSLDAVVNLMLQEIARKNL